MSTDAFNLLVGFGGTFLLGVVAFLIAWFMPRERRDSQTGRGKD